MTQQLVRDRSDKADSQIRAARITAAAAIIAALIAGGFAIAPSILNQKPEGSVTAKSIVLADDLPDTITASDGGVTIKGRLSQPLPSGQQLWSSARQSPGQASDGIGGPGFTVSELCDVSEDSKTFDCGHMQLGDDTRPTGRYVVYVGMASSSTARDLVRIRVEQERDDNWAHTVPVGFDAVDPQIVERK